MANSEEANDRPTPDAAPDKENVGRIRQSVTEYWKVAYDFYKYLMTVSLGAFAVFGALLGGGFSDPTKWNEDVMFAIDRNFLIYTIFVCLLLAAVGSGILTMAARSYIYRLGLLETSNDVIKSHNFQARLTLVIAVTQVFLPLGAAVLSAYLFIIKSTLSG